MLTSNLFAVANLLIKNQFVIGDFNEQIDCMKVVRKEIIGP